MSWWIWVLAGFGLLAVELLTPGGFFALFFGLSAIVVGVLAAVGFEAAWFQWALFAVLGVVLLLGLRNRLAERLSGAKQVDSLVGEIAFPLDDLAPGNTGRAELRGTPWTARNGSGVLLAKGQRCRVDRVDELVLFLRPE